MPLPQGIEGAKGLVEKITGLVRFPFFVRVISPGAAATAIIYPFWGVAIKIPTQVADVSWSLLLALAAPFVLGGLISSLGDQIYKVYEGRAWWPRRVFDRATGGQARRVRRLRDAADHAQKANRAFEYNEIWFKLRMYPLDEHGDPYTSHPTLLGNMLAEYESYPETRYGMDPVFYWPRLWLEMDKDKKAEIDAEWSLADGFLYLSAVGFCGGVLWIVAAGLRKFADLLDTLGGTWSGLSGMLPALPLGSPGRSATAGMGLMALGYISYRVSLPFHRRNGELFKSVFDLYRDKISAMTRLGPTELTTWKGTWSYLQYLTIRCVNCETHFEARLPECTKCHYPAANSLEKLKRGNEKPQGLGGYLDAAAWVMRRWLGRG